MGALTRVAAYVRVSTDEQAKSGYSLDAQKERLAAYCRARGWVVAQVYVDDGHSGRDVRRPAYRQMMDDRDLWDTILVIKMDRIHRNSRNFMEMMDDLRRWGKNFASATESLDTSTAMGRFVMDIIQRIAQLESEQIGERVYMGMSQKARNGFGTLGFETPFGFSYRDGHLEVDHEEATHVREIFDRSLAGEAAARIAEALNRRGVPSRRGGRWNHLRVLYILHNPTYAGYLRWDDFLRPANHPSIVSPEVFDRVQVALKSRIRNPRLSRTPALLVR